MNSKIKALDVHHNNAATNDPCAICGARTDPECGPELFLSGTEALVCYECGKQHDPELVDMLMTYRERLAIAEETSEVEKPSFIRKVASWLGRNSTRDDCDVPF